MANSHFSQAVQRARMRAGRALTEAEANRIRKAVGGAASGGVGRTARRAVKAGAQAYKDYKTGRAIRNAKKNVSRGKRVSPGVKAAMRGGKMGAVAGRRK